MLSTRIVGFVLAVMGLAACGLSLVEASRGYSLVGMLGLLIGVASFFFFLFFCFLNIFIFIYFLKILVVLFFIYLF